MTIWDWIHVHGDVVNGVYESGGAVACFFNTRRLFRDKHVSGVMWEMQAYLTSWGIWNLAYYPSLHQWFSFAGGVALVTFNAAWVAGALYYIKFPGGRNATR